MLQNSKTQNITKLKNSKYDKTKKNKKKQECDKTNKLKL